MEWFQGPTRLSNSESLNVFATSFIVYRKLAKPLKLNRGSAGLYIQTPINTAASPRHSPRSSPLKARRVLARNARLLGEKEGEWCSSICQCECVSVCVYARAQVWGRPSHIPFHAGLVFRVPQSKKPEDVPSRRVEQATGRPKPPSV